MGPPCTFFFVTACESIIMSKLKAKKVNNQAVLFLSATGCVMILGALHGFEHREDYIYLLSI